MSMDLIANNDVWEKEAYPTFRKNRKTRNLQIFITNYNASITYKYKITTSTHHSRSKTHERLRTIPNQVDTFSLPNAPKTLSKKVRERLLKSTTSRDRMRNASVTVSTSSEADTSRKGHPISLANRWPIQRDVFHIWKHLILFFSMQPICHLNMYDMAIYLDMLKFIFYRKACSENEMQLFTIKMTLSCIYLMRWCTIKL